MNQLSAQASTQELQQCFENPTITSIIKSALGDDGFILFKKNLISFASTNKNLAQIDPQSIINCALKAASINLPITNDLGLCYMVPFKGKGQLQISAKGFTEIALRSGRFKKLICHPVDQAHFKSYDAFTETLEYDIEPKETGIIAGYYAYLLMHDGFEKSVYWSKDKVVKHAQKYSDSYHDPRGSWQKNFDAMANKTVLKALLKQCGCLSSVNNLGVAINADQAAINIDGTYEYVDNQKETINITEDKNIITIEELTDMIVNDEKLAERVVDYCARKSTDEDRIEISKAINFDGTITAKELTDMIADDKKLAGTVLAHCFPKITYQDRIKISKAINYKEV